MISMENVRLKLIFDFIYVFHASKTEPGHFELKKAQFLFKQWIFIFFFSRFMFILFFGVASNDN